MIERTKPRYFNFRIAMMADPYLTLLAAFGPSPKNGQSSSQPSKLSPNQCFKPQLLSSQPCHHHALPSNPDSPPQVSLRTVRNRQLHAALQQPLLHLPHPSTTSSIHLQPNPHPRLNPRFRHRPAPTRPIHPSLPLRRAYLHLPTRRLRLRARAKPNRHRQVLPHRLARLEFPNLRRRSRNH